LVLDLSKDSHFSVQQKADGLELKIKNFDGKDAPRTINSSLIREIKVLPDGLWIGTVKGLRIETMRLSESKQAVVDLFTKPSNLNSRLAIARFYSDRGKYASADEAFYALDREYPDNDEILYHWGILLKRRGSSRADGKLRQISSGSAYYAAAQELLAAGNYIPPLPPANEPDSTVSQSLAEAALRDSIYQIDSLIVAVPQAMIQHPKTKLLDVVTDLASRYFILTLLLFMSTIVILSILIFGSKPKSHSPSSKQEQIGFEALTLSRMVSRLLADGWTHKEIARELKIGINEVVQIANQSKAERNEE
jgi:tetratricopeptide (TPR) repeat protein